MQATIDLKAFMHNKRRTFIVLHGNQISGTQDVATAQPADNPECKTTFVYARRTLLNFSHHTCL